VTYNIDPFVFFIGLARNGDVSETKPTDVRLSTWRRNRWTNEPYEPSDDACWSQLSLRALKIVRKHGAACNVRWCSCKGRPIETPFDLARMSEQELLDTKNCGETTVREIVDVLQGIGLKLRAP